MRGNRGVRLASSMKGEESAPQGRRLAISRHEAILRDLESHGAVRVAELAEAFNVSRETIRRDLKALAEQGRVNVVHGGAARRQQTEPALGERLIENAAGKAAIGRLAASLVVDGSVVLLDSGSTTYAVAEALAVKRGLTICTNSLPIALFCCRAPGFRVHLFGGDVDPTDEAAVGIDVIKALGRFRIDIGFVGIGGMTLDGDLTDYNRMNVEQRQAMIGAATASWVVLDHTKLERLTPVRLAQADGLTGILTDRPPPDGTARAIAAKGWTVLSAHI
jgi:DeoR family glycerol-3-phosphate regulon repressor